MITIADLTPAQQADLGALRPWFEGYCRDRKLDLGESYLEVLYSVSAWVEAGYQSRLKQEPLTLGISGAQGSGKSTFSSLLAELLTTRFNLPSCVLSLDDFYHTRSHRQALGREVHPLLAVRGAPGTHDITLMSTVIAALNQGLATQIPIFDKSSDDRTGYKRPEFVAPSVILLEGWCWGARPSLDHVLKLPINELERSEDPDAIWRCYVNNQLENYQPLFATDLQMFLKVPDFQSVIDWRWAQEQRLADGPQKMKRKDIERFVMHYERITRALLNDLPQRADLTLELDIQHRFSGSHWGHS